MAAALLAPLVLAFVRQFGLQAARRKYAAEVLRKVPKDALQQANKVRRQRTAKERSRKAAPERKAKRVEAAKGKQGRKERPMGNVGVDSGFDDIVY
jgi:hypothetical protein